MAAWNPDQVLDARGLSCPMPILKTKKIMKDMQTGQILEIKSTDPGTANDLPSFLARSGDQLLDSQESQGFVSYYVQKA